MKIKHKARCSAKELKKIRGAKTRQYEYKKHNKIIPGVIKANSGFSEFDFLVVGSPIIQHGSLLHRMR